MIPSPLRALDTAERRHDLLVDGLRIAVFERGAGPPCLLLHGYPQSHWCWRAVAPLLAATHRVLAPDWFGWGESERSLHAAPRYPDELTRLDLLLDTLGLARVDLIGHDYGGFLALGYAQRRPQRVRRLAILNSRAHATFPPGPYVQFGLLSALARTPLLGALLARLPVEALHRRSLRRYVANGSWSPADLERYVGWMGDPDGRRWFAHFYRHYRVAVRPELGEGCRRLRMPVALIWSDADPYCPFRIAEDLAARIPGARLVRLRGADHYAPEERPAEVAAALAALLATPTD